METFFLQKGLIISRSGELLEYASRTDKELYFENPETGRRETIEETDFWGELNNKLISIVKAFSSPKLLLIDNDCSTQDFKNLADVPESYQMETHRRLSYIRKLEEARITIGQKKLIAVSALRIAKEIEDANGAPSVETICRWWRAFRKSNNEVYAVISKNADRKPPVRIDEESERYLQDKIDAYYLINTRPSVAGAFNHYRDDLTVENRVRKARGETQLALVSYRTFYARIQARSKFEVMEAREGKEAARHHFKMITGHLPSTYPLDAVEIDHTPLNIYVIDDLAYLPLGRPWLTAIKDRYSGVLLGFFISYQATGLGSIFGAIKHSLHSHHRAYHHWPELENPWPAHGRGALYVSDRGLDFKSPRYHAAVVSLGAQYELCQSHTPWLKSSIERFFLTLEQTLFEAMPGRTFSNLTVRGDYDSVKHAVVRFSTLVFLLFKWAVDYHNIMRNSRKMASPLELWNEGIGMAPPPYPANVDQLNIILGERHNGALSHEGIRYKWLNYANEELSDLMKIVGRDKKVDYVVSAENLGHIHVKNPLTSEYIKVPCTRPDYASGLSLLQHRYLLSESRASKQDKVVIDTLIDTRTKIAAIIAEEVLNRETNQKSRLAKIAGINSNAVLEDQKRSVMNPFQGQKIQATSQELVMESPITDMPHYAWGT